MQFLYPVFLVALATLAIPVIIHLFYFRRYKKVYFTNVRFLKEIKEESSIRSRLKNLLILLCRLLAVLFLVLGFAQPFIKKDDTVRKGRKLVSVFVDNSYSMASRGADAALLDEAKQKAEEIVRAYQLEDQFQVITHDMTARQQRLIGQEQALAAIDEIELTAEVNPLSSVLYRQKLLMQDQDSPNQILYYISDFQTNITDFELSDTTLEYNLIPLQAVIEQNVSIDSAWFEAPVQMVDQANTLLVKVQNWSDQPVENIQLSIRRNGAVKPVGSLDIPSHSSVVDTVYLSVLEPGLQRVELQITDFPIQFDDVYYLSFEVKQQIRTLVVNKNEPNRYVDAAFASEQYFMRDNRSVTNLDYSSFNQYQLILLNELDDISSGMTAALSNYIEGGGNVLVIPSPQINLDSYNAFLNNLNAGRFEAFDTVARTVNYYNDQEFIFNDVFEGAQRNLRLPTTQGNYGMQSPRSGYERLLGYRDGKVYLSKHSIGSGHLYLSAAPIQQNYNNLVEQAEVFIPMLYKMALSTGKVSKPAYTIGQDNIIEIENRSTGAEVVYKVDGEKSFIPGQQSQGKYVILNMHDQIREAGFYNVFLDKGDILHTIAFNSNRLESDPSCFSSDEIAARYQEHANIVQRTQLADLSQFIQEKDRGIILWKYCLILALIFLALETLIIRFWST